MRQLTLDLTILQDRRPIPGWEDLYEIDQLGNVYALFPFKGKPAGRTMKPHIDRNGYVHVALSKDGKCKTPTVHRALMLAWCPIEDSDKMDVNHLDGNKQNNVISNLEWTTHKANIHHARRVLGINRDQRGDKAGYRKLSEESVRQIRILWADGRGMLQPQIAKIYGVSQVCISHVLSRKTWGHVQD